MIVQELQEIIALLTLKPNDSSGNFVTISNLSKNDILQTYIVD
jgi:hypothetical protein